MKRIMRMERQLSKGASTVSAVAVKCGMANIVPRECSCFYQVEQFQKMERWQENDGYIPKPGDIIYYDWQDNGVGDNTLTGADDPDLISAAETLITERIKEDTV